MALLPIRNLLANSAVIRTLAVALPVLCAGSAWAAPPPSQYCAAYFGVIQDDPRAPGRFIPRMAKPQADWFEKTGKKRYPDLCYSLEKARYLIVWTASKDIGTAMTTVNRTAQANTSTSGNFNVYGGIAGWGTYSGNSSTTVTVPESVPVTVTTDYCYVYVLRSVGETIWDDIRNRTPQPLTFYSTEARGQQRQATQAQSPFDNPGASLGNSISTALAQVEARRLTVQAFEASLKYIAANPSASNVPQVAVSQAVSPVAPAAPQTNTVRNGLAGPWSVSYSDSIASGQFAFTLVQDTSAVLSTYNAVFPGGTARVVVADGSVRLEINQTAEQCPGRFIGTGELRNGAMVGTLSGYDCQGQHQNGNFIATQGR